VTVPTPTPRRDGARRLGLGSAVALVVANMVGAGVFTTSGFAIADLGDRRLVLLAWLAGGALALLGASSYGALARAIPESGGEYVFLRRTIHPAAGFMAGWISLLAGFTAPIAAAALGLASYADAALAPWLDGGAAGAAGAGSEAAGDGVGVLGKLVATGAIVLATIAHAGGTGWGARAQNATVLLQLGSIAAFIVVGLVLLLPGDGGAGVGVAAGGGVEGIQVPAGAAAEALPVGGLGDFAVTLVWVSFSYSGWNAAVYLTEELRDPERTAQRALVLGTGLVTVLYLGLNGVFLYAAPPSALAGRPEVGAIAAQALGGPGLRSALAGVVALGLWTSISGMVMAVPRVYPKMASVGAFPRALGWVPGPGAPPPRTALALQAALAVLVVWVSTLRSLLGYIGFTLGLSAAATVFGLLRLRRRRGAREVPIPGYPLAPVAFLVASLGTFVFMAVRQPGEAAWGALTALSGLPLYALFERRRRRRSERRGGPRHPPGSRH